MSVTAHPLARRNRSRRPGPSAVSSRVDGRRPWPCWWAIIVVLLGLVAASCSFGQQQQAESESQPDNSAAGGLLSTAESEPKPVVTIAVTDWTAAKANGLIAEKLIERRLGYPVTLVDVVDIEGLLEDLSSGQVSAILEVWTSTLEESEVEFINSGGASRLGNLGVTAKVGWFVPRYVVDENPELATWEGYLDASTARKFATPESGTSGRFLGTNPAYVTYDEELIEALDLPFTVEYSGSDEATRSELKSKISRAEPVLAYWWTPTAEITEFDLVNVSLPDRDDECVQDFADGKPLRCDYPEEDLIKLGWPGLADAAPDLEQFLRNFSITTDDQLAITYEVESEGRSLDAVTTEWIEANQDRWESWLASE